MTNARPKPGVPVLAYSTHEPLSMMCYMRIFQKEDKQLSIALHVPVNLQGAEEEQVFVVQYDADNQRNRHPTAFNSVPLRIPNDRLEGLARHAEPETTTLTIHLKQPAPVWCPLDQVLTPQPTRADVTAFGELVELAKATIVHLVFDYKWLSDVQQASIQRLVKGKVSLAGYPLARTFARDWEVKDWTHFAPAPAPALPPEASNKRERPGEHHTHTTAWRPSANQAVSGSTSSSPPTKRAILDDSNARSPTEIASSPPEYAKPDSEADFQTQAIRHVVDRELPAILPAALAAVLPSVFAAPDPHINSFDSDASTFPKMQLTAAGAALIPHLLAHLQPQMQDIQDRALSRTRTQRENAELEFEEDVDNKKAELHDITERGTMELERAVAHTTDQVRHDLSDECENIVTDVSDQVRRAVDDVVDETTKHIGEIARQTLGRLVEREIVRQIGRPGGCVERVLRGVRKGKGGCRAVGRRERTSNEPLDVWQRRNSYARPSK